VDLVLAVGVEVRAVIEVSSKDLERVGRSLRNDEGGEEGEAGLGVDGGVDVDELDGVGGVLEGGGERAVGVGDGCGGGEVIQYRSLGDQRSAVLREVVLDQGECKVTSS